MTTPVTNFLLTNGSDLGQLFVPSTTNASTTTIFSGTGSTANNGQFGTSTLGTINFPISGSYLLSITSTQVPVGNANTNYYSVVLVSSGVTPATGNNNGNTYTPSNLSLCTPEFPSCQSGLFNSIPFVTSTIFNTSSGTAYDVYILSFSSDTPYQVTVNLQAMYLGPTPNS